MGQMMFTKIIVVVDEHVDVHNTSDVLFHLCANIDPQRDSLITKGPCDSASITRPTLPNVGVAYRLRCHAQAAGRRATSAAGRKR